MTALLRPTLSLLVFFTLLLGVACPLAFVGIGQLAFPHQANGSLTRDAAGRIIGSELIGQNFTGAIYFHGRPSALTGTDPKGNTVAAPYDASESGASNLAPTSAALHDRVRTGVAAYGGHDVPADAVTSSGSGLDRDISPETAALQAPAVAAARHLPLADIQTLVGKYTTGRLFGIFGQPRVDVLALNLALDQGRAGAPPLHPARGRAPGPPSLVERPTPSPVSPP